MSPLSVLSGIHWLSVLAASVASFAVGGLWYSMPLFGKMWASENKLTAKKIGQANRTVIFGLTFVLTLVSAVVMDLIIGPRGTLKTGIATGLVIGVIFIGGSFGINYLFSRKSLKLFLIDAWYFTVLYLVMGAILGAW
jgi:hypothetical protein